MSVIQKIQQRQKWVFGAIALALILFIVQEKFYNKGSSGLGPDTVIGKVNGESIDHTDFTAQEDLIKQSQQQEIDENQLQGYVWQNLVNTAIMNQEVDKAGLSYTNKEFGEAIVSNNPPDWFRQQFTNQQTGAYDVQAANNYVAQVSQQLKRNPGSQQAQMFQKAVLDPAVSGELSKKYQSLIAGAVYIPKWMADKTAADNSTIANISYVDVPYSTIADSTVKVSDDDINDFVKRHAAQFEQKEETRQVAYITFNASASAQDTASVQAQLTVLKGEFSGTSAADMKPFLEQKSSTLPFYNSYLSKSQIQQPVKDSLFKLQPGQIYGPYKDGGSFVLAKMIDIKQLPDSVRVRHILVATLQQDQQGQSQRIRDDSSALKRLDSAIALVNATGGKGFDSICAKYSDDPGSKDKGGIYDYFPTGKMVEPFNDFVFTGKKGDKKTVQTAYGYHYVEILDQKGSEPAYKIAYLGKPVTVSQQTDENAQNDAQKFTGITHNLKDFYANAAKIEKAPFTAGNIKENDYTINSPNPGMQSNFGKSRSFVQWVYKNDVGDISPAFRFGEKYVIAIITGISKPGQPSADVARPLVETKVRNEKKAKILIDTKIKGSTIEAIGQAANIPVQKADSVAFQSQFIPRLGQEFKVLGAAFNKQAQGKASAPIAGDGGVFVISASGIAGVAPQGGSAEQQRAAAQTSLKAQQQSYLQALIKAANIKDYRSKFY